MNRKSAPIWFIALAFSCGYGLTASEAPGIISGTVYKLTAQCSEKCLDVSGAGTADEVNVQQWTDNATNAQRWRVDYMSDGYYRLTALCSLKALEVVPGSLVDGGNVRQNTDVSGDNQRWNIQSAGDGWFMLTAKHSGKRLDVNGASGGEGANVQQWTANNTSAQKWRFTLADSSAQLGSVVTSGEYRITAKHSGLVLGLETASSTSGIRLVQQSDAGLDHQRWNISYSVGTSFGVGSKLSGLLMDVPAGSLSNGPDVVQSTADSSAHQQWDLTHTGSDWFTVAAHHSGKLLDISGISQAVGAHAIQWEPNGGDNQKWKLTPCYTFSMGGTPVVATVGYGDVVRVNPQITGTAYPYESCGTATIAPFAITAGVPFTLPTNAPGFFTYSVRNASNTEIGDFGLTVVKVDLSEKYLVSQFGYARAVTISVLPAGAAVRVCSSNPSALSVSIPTVAASNVSFFAAQLTSQPAYMVVQVAGPNGQATIARSQIVPFNSSTTASTGLQYVGTLSDGSMLTQATVTMTPLISNLAVTLQTFVSGVTFADSTTTLNASTDAFTASSDFGTYVYQLLRAPSSNSNFCHTIVYYQNGVRVSR